MSEIRFGTDGWRARIADEFTFANVRLVTQAIVRYVDGIGREPASGRGLVVGYDNRFQSECFAAAVAEVLAGNGIPVWLTGAATPTPVAAYAVKDPGNRGGGDDHRRPQPSGVQRDQVYPGVCRACGPRDYRRN